MWYVRRRFMNEYRSRKERERDIYVHSVYNAIGVYRVQFSLMFYICNIDARQRIVSINFSLSLSKSSSVINAYDRCRSNSSTINNFFLFFFRVYIDGRRKMYYIRYLFNHPSPLMPNLLSGRHAWAFPSIIETLVSLERMTLFCSSSNPLPRILINAISTPFILFSLSLSRGKKRKWFNGIIPTSRLGCFCYYLLLFFYYANVVTRHQDLIFYE